MNLCYKGYEYRCKRSVLKKSNWLCSKARHDRFGQESCQARVSLDSEACRIKLGKRSHNHPPTVKGYYGED